jgi:phosphoglycerate dehydrogenase-like enzyme
MRQVPEFGIVGSGRVARHFQHYFNLLGISVRAWSRREPGVSVCRHQKPGEKDWQQIGGRKCS